MDARLSRISRPVGFQVQVGVLQLCGFALVLLFRILCPVSFSAGGSPHSMLAPVMRSFISQLSLRAPEEGPCGERLAHEAHAPY